MNSTQGILEAVYNLLLNNTDAIIRIENNPQLSPYAKMQMQDYKGRYDAGAQYVAQLSICVNDYIKRPGMIEDLQRRPSIFPPVSAREVREYACMETADFAQLLYDICTENGSKLTPADDEASGFKSPIMMERCLYAAYVYNTLAEYLEEREKGINAISIGNGRQISITHKKYQYALTTHKNKNAYIEILSGGIMNNLHFTDTGELDIGPDESGKIEKQLKAAAKGRADAENFSITLIQQVFTAVFRAQSSIGPEGITVYMPKFCREMGIDINHSNANDVWGKLKVFEDCVGVLEGSKRYSVLNITAVDPIANTVTFFAPYLFKILSAIKNEPAAKKETKTYKYEIPGFAWLIHSTIVSERNEPAKYIVTRIIAGLMQRGSRLDSKLAQNKDKANAGDVVTYSISCLSIIEDTPMLQKRISTGATADKNKKLKRAFEGAYKLLKTRTDAYKYFVDLTVREVIPTMTTLDTEIIITHKGINAAYDVPKL